MRVRRRRDNVRVGQHTYPDGGVVPIYGSTYDHTCRDVVGNYLGVNPLIITKHTSKRAGLQVIDRYGQNVRLLFTGLDASSPFLEDSSDQQSYINRIVANGPAKPHVNVPLFIAELKDIPRMIRHAGDLLHKIRRPSGLSIDKEIAAATLAYNFGWDPLISDITKMLDFQGAVTKRQKSLNKIKTHGSYKSRTILHSHSDTIQGSELTTSYLGVANYVPFTCSRQIKVWGSTRWTLADGADIGRISDPDKIWYDVTGFNARNIPLTAWKLMPWSWMIDWFTDISNVLQANNNLLDFKPYNTCIMTQCNNTKVFKRGGVLQEDTVLDSVLKSRIPVSASPSVVLKLPMMDNFKMAILGSLAILKGR